MKSLIWFRNDLRIDDNPAMRAACDNSAEVHAIFLYSQDQLENHNEANVKLNFLIENLKCLSNSLEELNISLSIIESKGFDEDPELISKNVKEKGSVVGTPFSKIHSPVFRIHQISGS